MNCRIRVLIVDDSAIVRKILSECLAAAPDIEVVGTAPDAVVAQEKIRALRPDVLTLDLEMPRMDGLSFLRHLMQDHPMPVIVISSIAGAGCKAALDAVEHGAVEVLAKPAGPYSVGELRLVLAEKVRSAARARVRLRAAGAALPARPQPVAPLPARPRNAVVAIGASTGGTEAIRSVLQRLPEHVPPILIVQHIPPVFSRAFAERLDGLCAVRVREAADGDRLQPGVALVAPGDLHMLLRHGPSGPAVSVRSGPRVCYQRPSVDLLFQSIAEAGHEYGVGVLLTGMGADGAQGLLHMRKAGFRTIAQDEATSVVYGMPREAARIGAAEKVLPLDEIADGICAMLTAAEAQPAGALRL